MHAIYLSIYGLVVQGRVLVGDLSPEEKSVEEEQRCDLEQAAEVVSHPRFVWRGTTALAVHVSTAAVSEPVAGSYRFTVQWGDGYKKLC